MSATALFAFISGGWGLASKLLSKTKYSLTPEANIYLICASASAVCLFILLLVSFTMFKNEKQSTIQGLQETISRSGDEKNALIRRVETMTELYNQSLLMLSEQNKQKMDQISQQLNEKHN